MLTGENPWGNRLEEGNALIGLQRALSEGARPEPPKTVSESCRAFVDKCLKFQYKQRPYAHELLDDPWVTGGDPM